MACGFDFLAARREADDGAARRALRYADYAETMARAGRHELALRYVERALEGGSERPDIRLRMADALVAVGRERDALEERRTVWRSAQDDDALREGYRDALLALLQNCESERDWQTAVELCDQHATDLGEDQDIRLRRDSASRELEAERMRQAARKDEAGRTAAAAGAGAAAGATVGAAAGAAVSVGGVVGGLVVALLGLALCVFGIVLCLSCVGCLIGIPLFFAGVVVMVMGGTLAAGAPVAGAGIGGMGALGGALTGWLARRATAHGPQRGGHPDERGRRGS
jgi:hypothetical protein